MAGDVVCDVVAVAATLFLIQMTIIFEHLVHACVCELALPAWLAPSKEREGK